MSQIAVYDLVTQLFNLLLMLFIPVLGAAFLSGLITGILGAYTNISEPAVGLSARIVSVTLSLMIFAPWMGSRVVEYASSSWHLIAGL